MSIKKLFIWWHRRRAGYHAAQAAHKCEQGYGTFRNRAWNVSWETWHKAQIERLEKL